MAIDRLSSTSALIAALRSDAARKLETSNHDVRGATAKQVDRSAARARPSVSKLRRELVEIVRGVSPNDAEAVRALRPRLVRAILLWEFGPQLREHPEWRPMLDGIVQTLESDPEQEQKFAALMRELKSPR